MLSSNNNAWLSKDISSSQIFSAIKNDAPRYFETGMDEQTKQIVYKKFDHVNWWLVGAFPLDPVIQQRRIITSTILLLIGCTVFLAAFFSMFLSENFTRPINKIAVQVKRIAEGEFNQSGILKSPIELGELSRNIASMADDIQFYMEQSIRKEEERRRIEIKMLQSQINPHFLYNTLNSIKWMAVMQGADGIREMVTSLGSILKAAMGDINEKVSIREELSVLDGYIGIQRVRYKGKLRFTKLIDCEEILDFTIVKFTLQPLVENAIFHGIEPKEGVGEISISARFIDHNIMITICDNGVGMYNKKITEILGGYDDQGHHAQLKEIGLYNVNQRIKLVYGEQYGLSIESKYGEFTRVTLVIPAERHQKPDMVLE